MPANCSLLLEIFDDDRETVAWEVSTDPAHATPYLIEPHHYGEQQLDVAKCAATIGTVTVGVIDPAQITNDQDSGWMTERIDEVHGRRCRLRRYLAAVAGYVTIADGPGGEPELDSYAAYTWAIRDTREIERKVRAFDEGGTSTILPAGVLTGYGDLGGGDWLIEPTAPLAATFRVTQTPGLPGPTNYFEIDPAPAFTDTMREALASVAVGTFNGRVVWEFPEVRIMWRVAAGPGAWHTIDGLQLPSLDGSPAAMFLLHTLADPDQLWIFLRNGLLTPTIPDEPIANQAVELMLVYVGAASEDYPVHVEGLTAGEFLKAAYDGEYSPRDAAGDPIPTGIRYDEAALLAIDTPVRMRITEPIADLRDWLEKYIYQPTGWCPALDSEGRISPVTQEPPASTAGLPSIENANAEPRASWTGGRKIINALSFIYPRDYVPTDPDVEVAGDGLAELPQPVPWTDPVSVQRHGDKAMTIDGRAFRAISIDNGKPLDEDLGAEVGYQLGVARGALLLGRYARGAPAFTVAVMRSATPTLRAGSFVAVDLSWMPNPITRRRGLTGMGQVLELGELDCAWRELLVEMLPPPPAPITDLAAAPVTSTRIDLAWTLPAGSGGVKLHRSTSSGFTPAPGNLIDTLDAVDGYEDTGLTASTTYYYRAIAFNDAGDAEPSAEASATTLAAPTPPDLVSVLRTETEDGDLCSGRTWKHEIAWVTTGANDAEFEIRVLVATDAAGISFGTLASGLTTASSSIEDQTEVAGNIGGSTSPSTAYRKYRVRLVRLSDGATIEQLDTDQGTLVTYTDPCA